VYSSSILTRALRSRGVSAPLVAFAGERYLGVWRGDGFTGKRSEISRLGVFAAAR